MDGCGGHGLTTIAQAFAALDVIAPLPAERVTVTRSLHRVLAEPVCATCDLPPFPQSAVDGYAVRHADLAAGMLPVDGTVRAGTLACAPVLASGTAQRIFTGGMLPVGADTVVRQEWVERCADAIALRRPVEAGNDVRLQGEELAAGTPIATAGARVTPGLLAALAMAGIGEVAVRRAPRIAVLVTGDEVAPPGVTPRFGQIFDANGPLMAAQLAAWGYTDVSLRYVADSAQATREALARAFDTADLVLTTGGVSVGDHDHIPAVARSLDARELFWKVAQKPGKPLFAALRGAVALLGLPGNPASVLVNLHTHVRRALDRLEGLAAPGPAFESGVLAMPVRPDGERDVWLRVTLGTAGDGTVKLARLPKQASHMLSNMAQAGALAWIPAGNTELPAGTVARYLRC